MRKLIVFIIIICCSLGITFAGNINLELITKIDDSLFDIKIVDGSNSQIAEHEIVFSNLLALNQDGFLFSDNQYSIMYNANFSKETTLSIKSFSDGLRTSFTENIIDVSIVDPDTLQEYKWESVKIGLNNSGEGSFGPFLIKLTRKDSSIIIPTGTYSGSIQFQFIQE